MTKRRQTPSLLGSLTVLLACRVWACGSGAPMDGPDSGDGSAARMDGGGMPGDGAASHDDGTVATEAGCATGAACGGACVDLQADPMNCGACGSACTAPAHATAACVHGACATSCNDGYVLAGSACVPVVPPRLVAPLSGVRVTSWRPPLRWALATGTDGAHVQLCADPACETVRVEFDAHGSSGAPPSDLPPGPSYWRARGQAGTLGSAAWSPVWELWIPARSAALASTLGTVPDVDADGHADALVGDTYSRNAARRAYVFRGGASVGPTPAAVLRPTMSNVLTVNVAATGDVNGDGYGDVVVAVPSAGTDTGTVQVYLGSATGVAASATSPAPVAPDGAYSEFGTALAGVGDVNGDGYADVAVLSPMAPYDTAHSRPGGGRVYIYQGSATGLGATPARVLPGRMGYRLLSVAGAGDVNGDGFADVIVGEVCDPSAPSGCYGQAYVYLGSAAGLSATPAVTLAPPSGASTEFGAAVAGGGDVNGDGYADVAVAAQGQLLVGSAIGHVYLYPGSASGVATTPATTLATSASTGQLDFARAVGMAGDANGDGYDDVAVSDDSATTYAGRVELFLGSASGVQTPAAASMAGPDGQYGYFGYALSFNGDVDGDGRADLLVGAPVAAWDGATRTDGPGKVYLLSGTTSGFSSAPLAVLTGSFRGEAFGGSLTP